MARAVLILMRGKDILLAIGRVGWKVEPVLGPEIARATASAILGPKTGKTFNPTFPMAQVMSLPRIKIITAKRHIKKQVHWYFFANENR